MLKLTSPEYPVGDAEECADMIHEFLPVARAVIGLRDLKIISFDRVRSISLACNAPIQQPVQPSAWNWKKTPS